LRRNRGREFHVAYSPAGMYRIHSRKLAEMYRQIGGLACGVYRLEIIVPPGSRNAYGIIG